MVVKHHFRVSLFEIAFQSRSHSPPQDVFVCQPLVSIPTPPPNNIYIIHSCSHVRRLVFFLTL